jgi:hypothetical protein
MSKATLETQLQEAISEFKELDHAHQMAFATGNYRFIKAAAESKAIAFREVGRIQRKLRSSN